MKLKIRILFFMLLALGVAGFFVSQAENWPWMGKVVARRHFHASTCIAKLSAMGLVTKADTGFRELSTLAVSLAQKPTNTPVERLAVMKVQAIVFGNHATRTENPVQIVFTDRQKAEIDLNALQTKVDDLRKPKILLWTTVLFLAITVVQIVQFYLSEKESSRLKRIEKV